MTTSLTIDNLSFRWKNSLALLGPISGMLSPGRITALIGPNGAGKSTLLRLVAAFLKPLSGTIHYGDQNLIHMSSLSRGRILTLVPQILPLGFDLTVHDLLTLGTYVHRSWTKRIFHPIALNELDSVISRLKLEDLVNKPYSQLSGGEAQRALLGMALVQDTPILLLDEPTAHLDPGHAHHLIAYLEELARVDRKIVVIAYHDLATVGLFADEIWLMNEGQMMMIGPSEEVLTSEAIQRVYRVKFYQMKHPSTQRVMLLPP